AIQRCYKTLYSNIKDVPILQILSNKNNQTISVFMASFTMDRVVNVTTKLKIPKTEILITIVNESKYTLTNVTMYFNGTSVNLASPNIASFTGPSNM
ncbi:7988_t:CDS:1, partial [Gigaspora margarita]